ncbi:MAG: cupin domain-containing protein [Candidatus Thermoplasmatota archaeon]
MIVKNYKEIDESEVKEEGAKNVKIQWLIDEKIAPNFAMRRFVVGRNGYTPFHKHDWEHEVFVLSGVGALIDENGKEHELKPGNFALVMPNEMHQFKNKGKEDFIFLCLIPLK